MGRLGLVRCGVFSAARLLCVNGQLPPLTFLVSHIHTLVLCFQQAVPGAAEAVSYG